MLDGFSAYQTFLEVADAEAQESGWTEACCALVIYNFRYQASPNSSPRELPLTFIGTFRYTSFFAEQPGAVPDEMTSGDEKQEQS